jgi:hypothetical protein
MIDYDAGDGGGGFSLPMGQHDVRHVSSCLRAVQATRRGSHLLPRAAAAAPVMLQGYC